MWNYRVLAHDDYEGIKEDPDEVYLEICEVYYDKDKVPNGYADSKSIGSSNIKGLNWSLNKMKLALKKPILSRKNFPSEYKP